MLSAARRINHRFARLAERIRRSYLEDYKPQEQRSLQDHEVAARRAEDRRLIENSNLFHSQWYLQEYQDVAQAGVDPLDHFVHSGAFEGRFPNRQFNTVAYLRKYPLLEGSGVNPLVHHIRLQNGTAPSSPLYKPKEEFKTFSDYLTSTVFLPVIEFPYSSSEKYILSYMDSRRKYLREQYKNNKQDALVSVIMATYNRADRISDAIESLLLQSYVNWELLIVDDGGNDTTEQIVSEYKDARIRYVRLAQNHGPSVARNTALDLSRGEYVCYLDSDNTVHEDFLLVLATELQQDSSCDLVYCAQQAFHRTPDEITELFVRFGVFNRAAIENRNYIDLGMIMHRRSLVAQYGSFDPTLRRLVDWDLVLRYTADKPGKPVPCILSNYFYSDVDRQITTVVPIESNLEKLDATLASDRICSLLPQMNLEGFELMFSSHQRPFTGARRPVSIIVPSFEAGDYLRACIQSIRTFTVETPYEIIIVDNASNPQVVKYIKDLERIGQARVIANQANFGFTHAVNQGIAAACPSNDVVVLNNDAIVTKGWLDALQQVLADHPSVGLIVPRQVVLSGEKTAPVHQPNANLLRECDINLSAHHKNIFNAQFDTQRGYIELSFAPFFCVYIPRYTIDTLGLLDVDNGPHYRSDRLYCDLVRDVGQRRIIYTPYSKVYHFVQRATLELKQADLQLYQKMFVRNNWREISGHSGTNALQEA